MSLRPAVTLALVLSAMPAEAALAPEYQRLAELRAVLGLAEVAALGLPVERVEYVRTDLYKVTAGPCRLDVRIVGLPMPRDIAGPRRFRAQAGRRACGR